MRKNKKHCLVLHALQLVFIALCLPQIGFSQQIYGQDEPQRGVYGGTNGSTASTSNTGIPNIGIPLYSEFPVSLSYNASGVKPEQVSTEVGLGWSLEAGGQITRTVRGLRDEVGNFHPQGLSAAEKSTWNSQTSTPRESPALQAMVQRFDDDRVDTAPDEFAYSVMGRKGTFLFKPDGSVLASRKLQVYISRTTACCYVSNPTTKDNWIINSITVVFEDGMKCMFSKPEYGRSEIVPMQYRPDQGVGLLNTWKVTQIEMPGQVIPITFTYESFNGPSKLYSDDVMLTTGPHQLLTAKSGVIATYHEYVSSIIGPDFKLYFTYHSDYSDVPYLRLLTEVSLKSLTDKLLLKTVFSYEKVGKKRILLKTIEKFGMATGASQTAGKYALEYNMTTMPDFEYFTHDDFYYLRAENLGGDSTYIPAPVSNTAGVDHWGYYNGVKSRYNTLVGEFTSARRPNPIQHRIISLSRAEREPNPTAAQALILQKITYPSGGYTQYVYENNDYSRVPWTGYGEGEYDVNMLAGGLRIKRIIRSDGVNASKNIVKTYEYRRKENANLSSGVLTSMPASHYSFPYHGLSNGTGIYGAGIDVPYSFAPTTISYSRIKEINGDGSYSVYEYSTIMDNADITDMWYGYGGSTYLMQIRGNSLPNIFSNELHPFVRGKDINECMRGLLLKAEDYSASDQIVRAVDYTYGRQDVGNFVNAFEQHMILGKPNYAMGCHCNRGTYATTIYPNPYDDEFGDWHFWRAYTIYVAFPKLTQKIEKLYDQNSTTKFRQATESYTINLANYQTASVVKTDISGDVTTEEYHYVSDYSDVKPDNSLQMGGAIWKMKLLNMLTPVVEHRTLRNGKAVKGELTEFDYFTSQPVKRYVLETASPITSLPFNSQQYLLNSQHYKLREEMTYHSGTYKLLFKNPTGGTPTSTIWGYNNVYPIALVAGTNPYSNKVFYTSFEDHDGANIYAGGKTGVKHYRGAFDVPLPSEAGSYKLTYWKASLLVSEPWTYQEENIIVPPSGGSAVKTIGTNCMLDEVRLYPADALMTTYTYEPLYGITSTMDPNNIQQVIEYDGLGRKLFIKDNNLDIVKAFQYGKY